MPRRFAWFVQMGTRHAIGPNPLSVWWWCWWSFRLRRNCVVLNCLVRCSLQLAGSDVTVLFMDSRRTSIVGDAVSVLFRWQAVCILKSYRAWQSERLVFWLHIREDLGSDLGPKAMSPVWSLSQFSWVSPAMCWNFIYLTYTTPATSSIVSSHSIAQRCVTCSVERLSLNNPRFSLSWNQVL
jgi:hypothetical protein